MKTKLAKSLLPSIFKTKLAHFMLKAEDDEMPDIMSLLRSYSTPKSERNVNSESYIVNGDPDSKLAADIKDESNKANPDNKTLPYMFELLKEDRTKEQYRLAVYKLIFEPTNIDMIQDSPANVGGHMMKMDSGYVANLLNQGKANKYLVGIEKVSNKQEGFKCEDFGINEWKKPISEFVLSFDSKKNGLKEDSQEDEFVKDLENYVESIKGAVQKYNEEMKQKIQQQSTGGNEAAAPTASAPPAPGPVAPPPMAI